MPRAKGQSRNRELARSINAIPKGRVFMLANRHKHVGKTSAKKEEAKTVIRSRYVPL